MKVTVVTRPAPYGVSKPTGEFVEIESLVGSLSAKNGLRIRDISLKSMNQKMIDGYTDVMEINGLSPDTRNTVEIRFSLDYDTDTGDISNFVYKVGLDRPGGWFQGENGEWNDNLASETADLLNGIVDVVFYESDFVSKLVADEFDL